MLGHQIQGIAILAIEFHPRTKNFFGGHYYTLTASAGTPDSGYCYFGNGIAPENKIYPVTERIKLGLQLLGHQIKGIAILAN